MQTGFLSCNFYLGQALYDFSLLLNGGILVTVHFGLLSLLLNWQVPGENELANKPAFNFQQQRPLSKLPLPLSWDVNKLYIEGSASTTIVLAYFLLWGWLWKMQLFTWVSCWMVSACSANCTENIFTNLDRSWNWNSGLYCFVERSSSASWWKLADCSQLYT